jgi:hypothetical protein
VFSSRPTCGSACVGPQSSRELGPPSELDQTPTTRHEARQLSWGFVLYGTPEPEGFTTCGALPLTPLRSAYRVSHPLDGFHPLEPTRPCFMPGAPMRFSLRGLSPLTSRAPLGAVASPPFQPPRSTENQSPPSERSVCGLEALLPPGIRTLEPWCYPGLSADAPLGFRPSEAFPPPAGTLRSTLSLPAAGYAPATESHKALPTEGLACPSLRPEGHRARAASPSGVSRLVAP